MTRAGAHIRHLETLPEAVTEAWAQWRRLERDGCGYARRAEVSEALRNRQLCFAHAVYLEAIAFALQSGVGSRGSAIALATEGVQVDERLGAAWRIAPEDPAFRDRVLETTAVGEAVHCRWAPRREIPSPDAWFETEWARFREGAIYDEGDAAC
jgi:hypothetical protein